MPYRMYVLTTVERSVPVAELRAMLKKEGVAAHLRCGKEKTAWQTVVLCHADVRTDEIADIHRWTRGNSPADGLIRGFLEDLPSTEPASAVPYLAVMLPRIRVVYCFEIRNGTDREPGWQALRALFHGLHQLGDALLYCELEGFSNDTGHHITWEFTDNARGVWHMALVDQEAMAEADDQDSEEDDKEEELWCWTEFEMDLGNPEHRAAFRAGKVPPGVEPYW
jgi:hypothetical protein